VIQFPTRRLTLEKGKNLRLKPSQHARNDKKTRITRGEDVTGRGGHREVVFQAPTYPGLLLKAKIKQRRKREGLTRCIKMRGTVWERSWNFVIDQKD